MTGGSTRERHGDGPAAFLSTASMMRGGPHRFVTQVERALWHLGFDDVRNIDGTGDQGGDILALKDRERWVIQCKWKKHGPDATVGEDAVNEADRAKRIYRCENAMLATNARVNQVGRQRLDTIARYGSGVEMLEASHLHLLAGKLRNRVPARYDLRTYQCAAQEAIEAKLECDGRALLVLATGLGKTVVGGSVIDNHLRVKPDDHVLVVAHMKDLVAQLEKAMWRHLPKQVPTHLLTGDHDPTNEDGVICATVESALGAVNHGYRPDLVMIDETHHLAEEGMFADLLEELSDARQFGVTATPWRGDRYDIENHFGEAVYKLGIAEGMNRGYLAQVDYRLFLDNIDWNVVKEASEHGYSLKELNKRLFLPGRDQAVIDQLLDAWHHVENPRVIVFCGSVNHAERFRDLIRSTHPAWKDAAAIHSRMSRRDRDVTLAEFRRGDVPILCAVDVLNEGVDVPDVNVIVFLRVTHSRRIFVQQLGRGLRVRDDKERVVVLDFVSDIRRIAAVMDLRQDLSGDEEEVQVPWPSEIAFSNAEAESLMEEWIKDAASLETANDDSILNFPDPHHLGIA